jgi:hypothetical protein
MSSESTRPPCPDGRPGDLLGRWRNGVIHQVYVRSLRDSASGGRLPPDRAGWHLLEAVR